MMLCCFGRPAGVEKPEQPQDAEAVQSLPLILRKGCSAKCQGMAQSELAFVQTPIQQVCPKSEEHEFQEPWRARLTERLVAWVSSSGLRAAA